MLPSLQLYATKGMVPPDTPAAADTNTGSPGQAVAVSGKSTAKGVASSISIIIGGSSTGSSQTQSLFCMVNSMVSVPSSIPSKKASTYTYTESCPAGMITSVLRPV